jgi:hypothetical protein
MFLTSHVSSWLSKRKVCANGRKPGVLLLFLNALRCNAGAAGAAIEAQARSSKYILFVHICGENTSYAYFSIR